MALNAGIHWGLILRINTPNTISQEGWKWLLSEARFPFNYDGEIIGLGFRLENKLRKFGFRGSEAGQNADFIDVNVGFRTAETTVDWIERVNVVPLVDGIKPFWAWKLKNSGVYTVTDFTDRVLTKGTDVDWPPLIGKIY